MPAEIPTSRITYSLVTVALGVRPVCHALALTVVLCLIVSVPPEATSLLLSVGSLPSNV